VTAREGYNQCGVVQVKKARVTPDTTLAA